MTRHFFRALGDSANSSPEVNPDTAAAVDSDFVVILAALLCALVCVLGLVAVARCAWLRRLSGGGAPPPAVAAANKGVKKKVLRSLPKQTLTAEATAKFSDCAICLAEFAAGEEIRVLPQCAHTFHVSCIDTWLSSHSSCPSCRQILVAQRCHKCGSLPGTSTSTGGGGAETSEARSKQREDRFLP